MQVAGVPVTQGPQAPPPPPQRPRRSLASRLSLGHVITLLAGLLAMLLVFSVLRSRADTYRVAVADQEIRSGAVVTADAFRFVDLAVPEDLRAKLIGPGADAERLEGWIATRTIAPDELVTRGDFRPPAASSQRRAMSVPVDASHAVAGTIAAGDRVDIIQVGGDGRAFYAATGLEVLAVQRGPGGRLSSGEDLTITVAVSAQEALRVAAALRSDRFEVIRSTGAEPAQPDEGDQEPATAAREPATSTTAPEEVGG